MSGRNPFAQVRQERRRPLTLPEIRAIRRNASEDSVSDKRIADCFTLEGADDEEKAFLTVCRAVYGRSEDAFSDDNVPAEKLICSLLFQISYWPLTLDDLKYALEDTERSWKQREEAARVILEEMEETRRLLKQCRETRVDCDWPENEPSQRIQ
jgi:hypothetical protein